MKYQNIIMMLFAMVVISACNLNEVFDREQYKHVIALKSDGTFKLFTQEIDFSDVDSEGFATGFISATVGGSLVTEQAIRLNIVEDPVIFNQYNQYNYAWETYRYANLLPENRKIISNYSINIPAGERTGIMNMRIRVNGLSPDSTYMIPFRVSSVSAYEMNQEKNTVLYRLRLKNQWSSTANISQYSHKGTWRRTDIVSTTEISTMMQKHVYPLSANQVRIFTGDRGFEAKELDIVQWAMILTMDDAGNVTITPWDDSELGLKVTQMNDEDERYPNKYSIVVDAWGRQFKTFMLCYEFVHPENGQTHLMKEELKIEHRPEVR